VFRGFKQALDRWAIGAAAATLQPTIPRPDLKAAADLILRNPNFLAVADVRIPELTFSSKYRFSFPSPRTTPSNANNIVHGQLFRSRKPSLGTVLLVHGWNAEVHYKHGLPRAAWKLNDAGFDAMLIELPFHAQRRSIEPGIPRNFISEDLALMLRLVEQSLADFQAALLWTTRTSGKPCAVWGFSLGAWLTGLYCTVSKLPHAAVLTTPVSRMDLAIEQLAFCEPVRRGLACAPLDFSLLNLEKRSPMIPSARVLIAESGYDVFVPANTLQVLKQAWGNPAHITYAQSHISILLSARHTADVAEWLKKIWD
jgi:dienelactone hydrolase